MLALASGRVNAQSSEFMGRPIVDLIESLRQQDIRIIYSSELLPARHQVTVESEAATPFEQLSDILAPYGLDVELGPRDTWLVVRGAGASARPSARPPDRPPAVPPALETVVVTASRYRIERPDSISTTTFGRHMLENAPALGQDPIRVTQNLPGVTSNQLTARMHIRGGDFGEALIRLDGVRLYSPYHLKDFQSIFSTINPRIVESMDVHTGGFGARFGDALSGVVDIRSIAPTEPRHLELALNFLDASVLSSGVFADGRGSWITSLRRGNLDVLADAIDSDIGEPQYIDFFNKLSYAISSQWSLETGTLMQDDRIRLNDSPTASAFAGYDDSYFWIKARHSGEGGLETSVMLSRTSLNRQRDGQIDEPSRVTGSLSDERDLHGQSLSADWSLGLSDRLRVQWGFELSEVEFDQQFRSTRALAVPMQFAELSGLNAPPSLAQVALDQKRRALYTSVRFRIAPRFVTELGMRLDAQSVTDEYQRSPRLSFLFELSGRTSLRAAWGRYHQAHDPTALAVADGLLGLLPAEASEQLVLGLEHWVGDNISLRAEFYDQQDSHLSRRYENVVERVSLIPELLPDRFAIEPLDARSRGVEIGVEGGEQAFGWWANLTRARTRDLLPTGHYRKSWDEEWSIKAGGDWSGQKWTVTTSAVLRSGWPITALRLSGDTVVGERFNGQRLEAFTSLNVRASHTAAVEHGQLEWFIEVTNLLDRANLCCIDYHYDAGGDDELPTLNSRQDALLFGVVPNFGLRWQF